MFPAHKAGKGKGAAPIQQQSFVAAMPMQQQTIVAARPQFVVAAQPQVQVRSDSWKAHGLTADLSSE